MAISAIKGVYYHGKIRPLKNIHYKQRKEVIIIFLDKIKKNNELWEEFAAKDFLKSYSKKDKAYDKL